MPVEVFCCYARKDQEFLQNLIAHLMPLQREGFITIWSDIDINAGKQWEEEITKHLNTAQIILLLVSPDFMMSEYIYSKEMKRAIERHKRGEASVIPIILRWISWQRTPLGELQALPKNARPIKSWTDEDEAYFDTVEGIIKVLEERERKNRESSSPISMRTQEERERKNHGSSSSVSTSAQKANLYQLFFTDLLDRLRTTRPGITNARKAQQMPSCWFAAGKTGFYFQWSFRRDTGALRTELAMNTSDRDNTKKIFDAFFRQREAIEQEFGTALNWERSDQGKESHIFLSKLAKITDPPAELEETKRWAVDTMIKFVDVFQKRIKML